MIVRIATFSQLPAGTAERDMTAFRSWMASQPGFVRGHHCVDADSTEVVSITYWASREDMLALRDKVPPGGPVGLKPDRVAIYEVEAEF